ncbi:GNAT family N-acetyltransferase [Streptomyces sp. NBC_00287]|uniref:GNAT family N-acetyltransferase n=1 Tax=Streptomyces sp. NBC_00287 TaxID=2975702 RepID=UPI002E2AE12D|nr:GNAT family N-acetyltransferase [Streptomyces sp. NBC_00287]
MTVLVVCAGVYADVIKDDPFAGVDRLAGGLDCWCVRPGWGCVVGYGGGLAVGCACGGVVPPGAGWWGGLLTGVGGGLVRESGTRTCAVSGLLVRVLWRKRGVFRRLHDAVLAERSEGRATVLVRRSHLKVDALYGSWGWRAIGDLRPRIGHVPLMHAMLVDLR